MPLEVPPEDHDPYPDLNDSIRKTAMSTVHVYSLNQLLTIAPYNDH